MTKKRELMVTVLTLLLLAGAALAQTSAFNYQGRLTEAGNPANGAFQMQFKLFDSVGGAGQVGPTLSDVPVTVTQGTFTVKLDFGASSLSGANRWLDIAIRRNSGESYTTLSPREQITSSPYAVRTLSAASADNANQLGGVAAGQFVQTNDPRLTDARNPLPNSANYIQNTTSPQPSSGFNVSGNGTVGGEFRAGLLLAQSIAVPSGNIQLGSILSIPPSKLSITDGPTWTTSNWKSAIGMQNVSAIGWEENASGTRYGIGRGFGGLHFFRTAGPFGNPGTPAFYDMVINDEGNVGIGTTTPLRKFHVAGRGRFELIPLEPSTAQVCFNSVGDLLQCGASSLKWKTNVQPFRYGLDVIRKLRPISFYWAENGAPDFGLAAEDVARVAPELIIRNEKGETAGVKYEKLNLLLINALNQQQLLIERQQKQLDEMRSLLCRHSPRARVCKGR